MGTGRRLERAYLLAMLFGREFEVEANDFSLQIAGLAMMMGEADGSPALIARADLAAADDGGREPGRRTEGAPFYTSSSTHAMIGFCATAGVLCGHPGRWARVMQSRN
jgi:hypothetical protein